MNIEGLRNKVIAVARADQPSDQVPYTFEKRMMALILGRPLPDQWAIWAAPLWRAALSCVACVALFSTVSLLALNPGNPSGSDDELAQNYDQTMYAALDQVPEE